MRVRSDAGGVSKALSVSGMLVVSCDFIDCLTFDNWKYMGIIAERTVPAKFRPSVDI
jgi:hypothetical protein